MVLVTVGMRIKFYRLQKKLSQSQLAYSICTKGAISQYESSRTQPSTRTIEKIAKRLGIPVTNLIDGDKQVDRTIRDLEVAAYEDKELLTEWRLDTLGGRVRYCRLRKKLSQTELAKGLCSASAISQIESGKVSPNTDLLLEIARRLEVNLFHLLFGEEYYPLESHVAQAYEEMDMGDYISAIRRLESVLYSPHFTAIFSGDTSKGKILSKLGVCYFQIGEMEKAESLFIEALHSMMTTELRVDKLEVSEIHSFLSELYRGGEFNKRVREMPPILH